MTIVKSADLPFVNDEHAIPTISLDETNKSNTFTVFVGKNGTRKSFLLRNILNDSLRAISLAATNDIKALGKHIAGTTFYKIPSKVIAISAAPTDRFPSKPAASDRLRISKYDVSYYSYIGPRTAGNILSRNQSVDELVRVILGTPGAVKERKDFLCEITNQLRIDSSFQFGLDLSVSARDATVVEYLMRKMREADNRKSGKYDAFEKYIKFANSVRGRNYIGEIEGGLRKYDVENVGVAKGVIRRKSAAGDFPFVVYVDCKKGGIDTNGITLPALEWAVRVGFLRPGNFTFRSDSGTHLNQDDLSSGQWSLFSTMVTLSLAVTNQTLVLIDEPETGLHPAWQRTFLGAIKQAIAHVEGCHVLLATHSPLVLSSLDPHASHLIVLNREIGSDEVRARQESIPFGWDASLILQDTFDLDDARAPELTDLVDEALLIIAGGKKSSLPTLRRLVKQMQPYYNSLPEADLGKGVIRSIMKVAGDGVKSR